MKLKNMLSGICAASIVALSLVGCSDYDNGFTDKEIAFQEAFRKQFGEIDPNHTWSTVTRSTLTVGVDMPGFNDPYTVRVYTANPRGKVSNCYLLGQWTADNPTPQEYVFDMPAGLSTAWVAVTNKNGGRYVQEAKIIDHKCEAYFTLVAEAYGKTRAVSEPDTWHPFPYEYYRNDAGTGFTQIYPEDDVNYESGICTDFDIVATGTDDIRLTHFYSNTDGTYDIMYFVYNPDKGESLEDANRKKENHKLLCKKAAEHIQYYKGQYNEYGYWNGSWAGQGSGVDKDIEDRKIVDAPKGFQIENEGYAVRGKTVTIPASDLEAGDHIVLYLTYGKTDENGEIAPDNKIAATRAILNEKQTAFAGELNFGERTYIGFEDALFFNPEYTDRPNGAYDLNDVVYVIDGGFTIEDHEDELPRAMNYIIAYEDLGISDDFDFNDLVVRVSRVSGTPAVTLSVLAAGGTLPISMYHTRDNVEKVLFDDIHKLFGQTTETVINALPGKHTEYTPIKKTIELPSGDTELDFSNIKIVVQQRDGKQSEIHAPQYYDLPSENNNNTLVEGGISDPLLPYAILIADPNWEWPDENENIADKYDDFAEWVKNADHVDWYGSKWKEGTSSTPETPSVEAPSGTLEVNKYYPLPFEPIEKWGEGLWCTQMYKVSIGTAALPEGFSGRAQLIVMRSGTPTDNGLDIFKMGETSTIVQGQISNDILDISLEQLLKIFEDDNFVLGIYDETVVTSLSLVLIPSE